MFQIAKISIENIQNFRLENCVFNNEVVHLIPYMNQMVFKKGSY